jgi:hypothetical protein
MPAAFWAEEGSSVDRQTGERTSITPLTGIGESLIVPLADRRNELES